MRGGFVLLAVCTRNRASPVSADGTAGRLQAGAGLAAPARDDGAGRTWRSRCQNRQRREPSHAPDGPSFFFSRASAGIGRAAAAEPIRAACRRSSQFFFIYLFIYVLIDYSRATYLDHGETMYSPFPVRADGQRCCDRCFRKSCFDPNSWIGCSVAHITPFQYTSVSI